MRRHRSCVLAAKNYPYVCFTTWRLAATVNITLPPMYKSLSGWGWGGCMAQQSTGFCHMSPEFKFSLRQLSTDVISQVTNVTGANVFSKPSHIYLVPKPNADIFFPNHFVCIIVAKRFWLFRAKSTNINMDVGSRTHVHWHTVQDADLIAQVGFLSWMLNSYNLKWLHGWALNPKSPAWDSRPKHPAAYI